MAGEPDPSRRTLRAAWGATLLATVALSVFGRRLQAGLVELVGRGGVPWAVGFVTVVVAGGAAGWLVRGHGRRGAWAAAVLLLAAVLGPLALGVAAERVHVALFGLFGFLSVRLHGPFRGVAWCLAFAALDEGLQGWLPDRVADWRDVRLNSISALAGALVAEFGARGRRGGGSAPQTL